MKLKYKNFVKTYGRLYKNSLFYPKFLKLKKENIDFKRAQGLLKNRVPYQTLYSWWFNRNTSLPFKDFTSVEKEFSIKWEKIFEDFDNSFWKFFWRRR